MISNQTVEPSTWGNACEAWTLLSTSTLHVMQERMPPATLELRHVHEQVRQFYFVLAGTAAVEVDGRTEFLSPGEGIQIEPQAIHQLRNDSSDPLEFLVISSGPPRDDRRDLLCEGAVA